MSEKYRIIIAEDHTIVRDGLRALLTLDPELEVAGEACDGLEVIKSVEKLRPDLVLMDISMPRMDGMAAISEIKTRIPETKILVLTVHENEECVLATFRAGANGYVLKEATHAELIIAIKTVLAGRCYITPAISDRVIAGYLEGKKGLAVETSWDTLTSREREILKLVAEGYKNKEIADFLCISVRTAEKHRSNLMKKLDLHSVSAMTAFAIEKGLIQG